MQGQVFTSASFLSPLPALGPGGPRGLELRHRVAAQAVTGREMKGSADIRLSADRRVLRVRLDLVAPRPGVAAPGGLSAAGGTRIYLGPPGDAPAGEAACAQLIVALDHLPNAILGRLSIDACFDAADAGRDMPGQSFEDSDVSPTGNSCVIDGISWVPGLEAAANMRARRPSRLRTSFSSIDAARVPRSRRRGAGEREYMRRRLLDETRAALRARSVAATAIHATLANHYAKGLIAASEDGAAADAG